MPPRDPGYQSPPGSGQRQDQGRRQDQGQGQRQDQGSGAGRHASGPGFGASRGPRPGTPGPAGTSGPAGPAEAPGQFDGGYAYVIRASDNPVRPAGPARPATPGGEVPGDVYVYRDTGGRPDDHVAAASGSDENDAAYWYDLPGTGSAGTSAAGAGPGGDAPQVPQEIRGPFEPLVSSAGPATPDAAHPGEAPGAADDGLQDTAHAHARKLEQIKDLYLTAEAIGEVNVDKHFDHLLAQQRELISEYFRQSGAARPAAQAGGRADTEPGDAGDAGPAGGPAGASDSARVAADQRRAW